MDMESCEVAIRSLGYLSAGGDCTEGHVCCPQASDKKLLHRLKPVLTGKEWKATADAVVSDIAAAG